MIHTDRQLAKSREQVDMLLKSIADGVQIDQGIDPAIVEAGRRGVLQQASELSDDIREYELLKQGATPVPDLSEIQQLHENLIRARIALGLTQRDLAERLGIAEQQVQRYEANGYAGASLARLREVAGALGQDTVETPAIAGVADLRAKLKSARLSSALVDRLVPYRTGSPAGLGQLVSRAARALGVTPQHLLNPGPLHLSATVPAYKLPTSANAESVTAYSIYAHQVAQIVESGASTGNAVLPNNPEAVRQASQDEHGVVTVRGLLEMAWDCGVIVVPLNDQGEFHAAFWNVNDRPVIILKQRVRSNERWTFDLAHELCHVADHLSGKAERPDGYIDPDVLAGWADDPLEQRANRFAGRVVLGPDADAMAARCAELSNGSVERMKRSVEIVAKENAVAPGALANYVAFRLAGEGISWWGAATNLQSTEIDPWSEARDILLERLDFGRLDQISRALLIQAMAE